ncbi:hypothetical protein ACFQ60_27985 [Streptomyces zhihengii]
MRQGGPRPRLAYRPQPLGPRRLERLLRRGTAPAGRDGRRGIVTGFQGLKAQDDIGWSDDELTSAVEGATASLNGSSAHGGPLDGPDTPEDFDGAYGIKVRQEIVEHGSGDAPQFGVSAEVTGEATADHARYAVSADGASAWFCMDVTRAHTGWARPWPRADWASPRRCASRSSRTR